MIYCCNNDDDGNKNIEIKESQVEGFDFTIFYSMITNDRYK